MNIENSDLEKKKKKQQLMGSDKRIKLRKHAKEGADTL